MDHLQEAVAAAATIADPEGRAIALHRLLYDLQESVRTVSGLRRDAVIELRSAGWSHAEIASLLGIHRNRAAHIVNSSLD